MAGPIENRQSATTCGNTAYSAAQVRAAANAACSYYRADDTAGSSTYPHTYNNREGFDFLVSGPYQEFPIKSSGVYTGGMSLDTLFWCLDLQSLTNPLCRLSWR